VAFNPFNPDEYKTELSLDVRFRQALNLAVNREEINNSLYFGLAVPRQAVPIPSETYYDPDWEQSFAQYDPAGANALLDEIGLSERDADGHRIRADNGETLSWVIEFSNDSFTSGLELVREYFEDVGLMTTIKIQDGGVLEQRMNQSLTDMLLAPNAPRMNNGPFVRMYWNLIYDTFLHLSNEYGEDPLPENWIDVKPKPETAVVLGWEISGAPSPDWYKEMYYDFQIFGGLEPGTREYNELGAKLGNLRVEKLWEIGVVGLAPKPFIVQNSIGNTPDPGFLPALDMNIVAASHFIDQLYRK
jgi:peptide/nickel transport system substrate-binding protein